MSAHVVIGVHGLSPKPTEDILTRYWVDSICEGLRRNFAVEVPPGRLGFDLVYWADWLGRPPYREGEDPEPYKADAGSGPFPAYSFRWIDPAVRTALGLIENRVDWVAHTPPAEWIRERVGLDEIGLAFLRKRLVDLGTYYSDTGKRDLLRQRLAERLISHEGKKIMLIAHSMGSIVAYDVLRILGRERPNLAVEHFITLGSPLGLGYVLSHIRRENAEVRTPSMVRRWTNLADRRDPVAIDVHLGDEFQENARQIAVEDALVLNRYVWPLPDGKHNHHKIYGYLRTPEFSQLVKNFI